MESIIYVGMDVHKDSYSVCCYKSNEDRYYYEKKTLAESKRVIKYLEAVKKELTKAKLVLQSFLLRHDKKFAEGVWRKYASVP